MSRFTDLPAPSANSVSESVSMVEQWDDLKEQRQDMDAAIQSWADNVTDTFLEGQLSWYSGSQKRDVTGSTAMLVTHMFNHQTHHRGQVHAMITQAGGKPDDTDLFILAIRNPVVT